jgi:ubiquitin-protein ligase
MAEVATVVAGITIENNANVANSANIASVAGLTEEVSTYENYAKIKFAKKRLAREFESPKLALKIITDTCFIERIDEMFVKVKIFKIKNATLLESIKKLHLEYIEIGIRITEDYPFRKPFVWIIKPLLKYKTNNIDNIDMPNIDNNADAIGNEINNQIQWLAAFGIDEIINQTIELLDNDNWFIDENELQK